MERERLRVENFACLREVDLEVGGINILIGPQATGKSVLAKLLYFFQGFADAMLDSLMSRESEEQFRSERLSTFETYFPAQYLGTGAFDVCHSFSPEAWVRVSRENTGRNKIQIKISSLLLDLFKIQSDPIASNKEMDKSDHPFPIRAFGLDHQSYTSIYHLYRDRLKKKAIPFIRQMFIPTGRTFFSQPETLSYRFMKEGISMDPFLVDFGSQYNDTKERFLLYLNYAKVYSFHPEVEIAFNSTQDEDNEKKQKKFNDIVPLIENVLRGSYVRKNEKDYLELSDGRRVDLLFASSGQQEFLPLAITLAESLFAKSNLYNGAVKYIEEPEAHLFPTSQHEIVKLMATVFNNAVQPLRLVITTHSPYILTAFNNLIQAGETREKLDKSRHPELFQIVPEDQILAPDAVCAYEVDHGTATPIRSEETGNLILAERLDGVSTEILSAFDKLLDLE